MLWVGVCSRGVKMCNDIFFWEVHQLKQCLAVLRHCKSLKECDEKFCNMIACKEKMICDVDTYLK